MNRQTVGASVVDSGREQRYVLRAASGGHLHGRITDGEKTGVGQVIISELKWGLESKVRVSGPTLRATGVRSPNSQPESRPAGVV